MKVYMTMLRTITKDITTVMKDIFVGAHNYSDAEMLELMKKYLYVSEENRQHVMLPYAINYELLTPIFSSAFDGYDSDVRFFHSPSTIKGWINNSKVDDIDRSVLASVLENFRPVLDVVVLSKTAVLPAKLYLPQLEPTETSMYLM